VKLVDYNAGTIKFCAENDSPISSADAHGESNGTGEGIHRDSTISEIGEQNTEFVSDMKCHKFSAKISRNRWCVLCSNPLWRKISFLLGGQWFGLAFMYYGAIMAVSIVFSNIQNDTFDYGAIFIASSAETVGLTLAILLVDRIGRVKTQILAYTLGGFCLLLLGILDFSVRNDATNGVDQEEGVAQRRCLIFFAFLSRMFVMGGTSVTWLHTAELLPTRIRATGHGLANAMGRIGGITCPFIISRYISPQTIGIVMFSVSVATSIIVKCIPETSGEALGSINVFLRKETTGRSSLQVSSEQHDPVSVEGNDETLTIENVLGLETDDKSVDRGIIT